MQTPKTANEFEHFMNEVWAMDCQPHQDGVALHGSHLYDEYHDAVRAAERFGARRTGGSKLDGQFCHVYRFPADQDRVAILITHKGDAIKVSYHRWNRKRSQPKCA